MATGGMGNGRHRGVRPHHDVVAPSQQTDSRLWLFLALIALLAAVIAIGISRCSAEVESEQLAAYAGTYDSNNLTRSDGRVLYVADGLTLSKTGIDVSDLNGTVDWSAVAGDGIDFAYLRVGYRGYGTGAINADGQFSTNLSGAKSAGLDVGVYFFSQATSIEEAQEEADYVLDQLDGTALDLPIAFDEETVEDDEGRANGLTTQEQTDIANAFLSRIRDAGYQGMLYCNSNDASRFDFTQLAEWQVWYAQYEIYAPTTSVSFRMWQYTHTGSVAGVDGNVDLDVDLAAVR